MRNIQVSRTIPTAIRENTRPGGWVGGLTLAGDIDGLIAIEASGAAALNFALRWDAALGLATIDPAAVVDYEAFIAGGSTPELAFSLEFVFADGSRQADATIWRVAVLDEDDTAPSALRLATGGSVTAGAIGSIIGTLAVTDVDSAGPFSFSFPEEDAWRFEVVGTTLKLRDGISLGLDDMPARPLFITVSDGRQSAGFTLDLTVRDPGTQESAVDILAPEAPQSGFALADPQQVVALRQAREVTAANTHDGDIRQLMLAEGGEVWLPAVQALRLADGWVDFDPAGLAVRASALVTTLATTLAGPQQATGAELGAILGQAQAGQGWVDLAADLLAPELAGTDDAGLVSGLFQAALGRAPDAAEFALHTGRLASGVSRAQVAADVAGSPEALAEQAAADGLWVFQPLGGAAGWQVDTGGLPAGMLAEASQPIGEAWLF
jgi:hypothetical protein